MKTEKSRKTKEVGRAYNTYQPHLKPIDKPKGERVRQINIWLADHRKIVLAAIVALIIILGGIFTILFSALNFASIQETGFIKKQPTKIYSPLSGKEVSEADSKRPVTAVIIENSPESRPQSGLKESGVVFEAIAEGGITRFLVLYQEDQPQLIGPVRSLRPYYVDWLAAFDPSVAHVGGSLNALNEIRSGRYKDIDQFSNTGTYWRATDRYAPHNVYTNFEKLNQANQEKGYQSSTFTGFPRKDDSEVPTANATAISVPISSPLYNSSYTYDAASNSYMRAQGGAAHTDREKGAINPKVVIVMEAAMNMAMEDGYREQIQTIGSGKVTIFQDGVATTGTWSKKDQKSQIKFTDQSGADIPLNRGQTWITVIPTGRTPAWQ